MMVKKIEVKVSIHCHKCKSDVLKSVTKLQGIDQVSVDSEKGILTVIGNVDPVLVANQVRKTGKVAELTGVGPPKAKETPPPKPPTPVCIRDCCCNKCQLVAVSYAVPYDNNPFCSIL
ncbi:heavy metal-associated isoprenylated plant protein 2-like [Camellia sinensis]|uniref:heavy metal-associated isoprenylated plant protein 2-like n=1 Tax=Camellia sinensis TaxID=4442 RepID=UPI00103557FC|nr:heavy metal-associated isoprenylated plant protein 2-like [Camellia sinensis]